MKSIIIKVLVRIWFAMWLIAGLPCGVSAQEFRELEINFNSSEEVNLSGSLSFPEGKGPFPAIVLVAGSGHQDRNSEVFGFKLFEAMADYFNKEGYAVLRYDERGVGKSLGPTPAMSTTHDLAMDAAKAVDFLLNQEDIDHSKIGLLGHSEGGVIVPKVAVENSKVSFLVLLAGYGVPGYQVTELQQRKALEEANMPKEYIDVAVGINNKIVEKSQEESVTDSMLNAYVLSQIRASIDLLPDVQKNAIPDKEAYARMATSQAIAQLSLPWMKYYFNYDPGPTLCKVKCPVLLLFGELDTQVTVAQNQQVMLRNLKKGGNSQVTTKVFDKANHLFQASITGSISEYAILKKEFVPELLPAIISWLNGL